jgi:hypothetical protein
MPESGPARVLIVPNPTAATPAVVEAARERAGRGPCSFTLLVPQRAAEVMYGDEEARKTIELAVPSLEEAAGGPVASMIGSSDAPLAVKRALIHETSTSSSSRRCRRASRRGCTASCRGGSSASASP